MPKKKTKLKVEEKPVEEEKPTEEEPTNFLGELEPVATEEPTAEEETEEAQTQEEVEEAPSEPVAPDTFTISCPVLNVKRTCERPQVENEVKIMCGQLPIGGSIRIKRIG